MAKRSDDRNNLKNGHPKKICENKELITTNESVFHDNHTELIKNEKLMSLNDNECEYSILTKGNKLTKDSEQMRTCDLIRLSHFVIVDSVLNETTVDPSLEAVLPLPLNNIYQKFIMSKSYIHSFLTKEKFYRGVGLFGTGIEERIFQKRIILEESMKRKIRLRPNPKPRRQFDGTVIKRASHNVQVKCNIFTIGTDSLKRSRRIGKVIKKRSVVRKPIVRKMELFKKTASEPLVSSDESKVQSRSIALSRTKRNLKRPQLDFKYCYKGTVRSRKMVDTFKDDQFMEIDDSDSSSVIEICPPIKDRENDSCYKKNSFTTNNVINPRKFSLNTENKVLNILDKIRLGLQCIVIQTGDDVIIQNLTLDDLSTLRHRLQGLATFKNIEAEYDKNGEETARVTIDRKALNLPWKRSLEPWIQDIGINCELMKKKVFENKRLKKEESNISLNEYCTKWVWPKVRSVKKVRKLYTQPPSTPNILARSQPRNTEVPTRTSHNKHQFSVTDGSAGPVSFYPQILSIMSEENVAEIIKTVKPEQRVQCVETVTSTETSSNVVLSVSKSLPSITTISSPKPISPITISSTSDINHRRVSSNQTIHLPNGTPATAMSASQLLMLKKGAASNTAHSTVTSESPVCSNTSIMATANTDQKFTNQILKPFKKPIATMSPSKLEIDEADTDFELSPSLIAQRSPSTCSSISTSSASSLSQASCFISKPLIQTTSSPLTCRTVRMSLTNPMPLFTDQTAIVTCPNPRIKHRKWTHNFMTSNSINIREVLCASGAVPSVTNRCIVTPPPPQSSSSSSLNHPAVHPSIILPTTVSSIKTTSSPSIVTQTKGSSVVLKSLLVGHDSCNRHNTTLWTPKCLPTNPVALSSQDSKIKWQVGGTVLSNVQSPLSLQAKENKSHQSINNK